MEDKMFKYLRRLQKKTSLYRRLSKKNNNDIFFRLPLNLQWKKSNMKMKRGLFFPKDFFKFWSNALNKKDLKDQRFLDDHYQNLLKMFLNMV